MNVQPAGHFAFGQSGNGAAHLREGWSAPERDFTWTQGVSSRIRLPPVTSPGTLVLEVGLRPFVLPPVLPVQRLIVSVNGTVIGDENVAVECTIGLDVPSEAIAGQPHLDITLQCPNARSPASLGLNDDSRLLGMAVFDLLLLSAEAVRYNVARTMEPLQQNGMAMPDCVRDLTGLTLPALAANFESLGHDCEFGLAQRQMGADHPGLLRFAAVPPRHLLLGLDQGFEGLGAPGTLSADTNDAGAEAEFMVRDKIYGMVMHTHQTRAMSSVDALLIRIARHLNFLRCKMAEDLEAGHKIFVYNYPGLNSGAQSRPLLNILRSHGPNTLLCIRDDGREAPGTVRQEAPDLLVGWVGELGKHRAGRRIDLPAWISVCANAYRLWRDTTTVWPA